MATIKSEYYRLNGSSWDLYYFRTSADLVAETSDYKVLTAAERTKITNHLTTFNAADKLLQLDGSGKVPSSLIPGGLDYLPKSGGTMTGPLNLGNNNIEDINKITKPGSTASIDFSAQDELVINGVFRFDGSDLNVGGGKIRNLQNPITGTDAANRQFVEQLVAQGTHVVGAVRVASTTDVSPLIGFKTVDGVVLAQDDRVLIKDNTQPEKNGVYRVHSTSWTKIANDSDAGSLVFVTEGTTNKGKQFYNKDGTAWELFFIQDTYYASLDGGLELDNTGFGFGIKEGGVTADMLFGDIPLYLLEHMEGRGAITSGTTDTWTSYQQVVEGGATVDDKVNAIFRAIQKLRGTENLLTNNTQSISDAYNKIRLKNKIDAGSTVPSTPAGYDNGDVYLKILSTT